MTYTIFCTLDQAIDYVQAFRQGGWDGLREAIKQERQTKMTEYDNSNQVALWAPKDGGKGCYRGGGKKDNMGGVNVYRAALVTREMLSDRGPIADLWLHLEDGTTLCIGIFKGEKGLSGQTDDLWVNVWDNRKDQGNGPAFRVKFVEKEPQGAATGGGIADDDEIPF